MGTDDKPTTAPTTTTPTGVSWATRFALLGALSAQFATHTLVMRYSRGILHEKYNPAAVVLFVELLKVTACSIAITFFPSASSQQGDVSFDRLPRLVFDTPPLILIPAASFFAQNVLAFVALKHLQPSVFVVLSQLKIVSTTIFSIFLLHRKFTSGHWRSLVLLIFATILVDPSAQPRGAVVAASASAGGIGGVAIGVMAVLAMATLSGFSSVVLERVLKGTPSVTIWERNLQLGVCSVVLALISVSSADAFPDVLAIASLQSGATLTAACVSAFGGILVALVMRYADNVVKCFATAVGICVTSSLSVFLFNEDATRLLLIGIGLVIISILNYNAEPPSTASSPPSAASIADSPSHVRTWKMAYVGSLCVGIVIDHQKPALIWAMN